MTDVRIFAGLALGGWWEMRDGKTVQVHRAVNAESEGIDYIRLKYDTGEMAAADFLTYVRAGDIEPRDTTADDAYQFVMN